MRLLDLLSWRRKGLTITASTPLQAMGASSLFDNVDYQADLNSAVFACLQWAATAFPEAPLQVAIEDADGNVEQVKPHLLTDLVRRPNPFTSRSTLWGGSVADLVLNANTYWQKVRNPNGTVVELYQLPSYSVTPFSNDAEYLAGYRVNTKGGVVVLPPSDIVHFRRGVTDPSNRLIGLAPRKVLENEVLTDAEAVIFTKAVLSNLGVVGLMVTPKDSSVVLQPEEAQRIAESIKARYTGDKRGGVFVPTVPMSVDTIGATSEGMVLDKVQRYTESRISAVLGVPAVVAGLAVGLESSTNNATDRSMREAAFEQFIVPLQSSIAEQLDLQLLAELTDKPDEFCRFDYRNVRVLQEDQNDLYKRASDGFSKGWLKRSEARNMVGLASDPTDDVYFIDPMVSAKAADVKRAATQRSIERRRAFEAGDHGLSS